MPPLVRKATGVIQAFPIHATTAIHATATDENIADMSVVHAQEDGTITFHFPTGNKAIPVVAGADLGIGPTCTGITATAAILIS